MGLLWFLLVLRADCEWAAAETECNKVLSPSWKVLKAADKKFWQTSAKCQHGSNQEVGSISYLGGGGVAR